MTSHEQWPVMLTMAKRDKTTKTKRERTRTVKKPSFTDIQPNQQLSDQTAIHVSVCTLYKTNSVANNNKEAKSGGQNRDNYMMHERRKTYV